MAVGPCARQNGRLAPEDDHDPRGRVHLDDEETRRVSERDVGLGQAALIGANEVIRGSPDPPDRGQRYLDRGTTTL